MNTKASAKIIQLRELLAAQFPAAAVRRGAQWATGLAPLDEALGGGLWKGGIVELVAERPSSGGSSLLRGVLERAAAAGLWAGLIDGCDAFDPASLGPALTRLLWLRCHDAAEAIQSADLLLRDGNLPLVCLDLHGNPAAELRRITGPTWYRLQRMLEPTAIAFLALTPFALVPCADVRVLLRARFSLAELEDDPAALWDRLTLQTARRRPVEREGEAAPLLATA